MNLFKKIAINALITVNVVFSIEAAPIALMENFDPKEWHHVHINLENLEKAAEIFSQNLEDPDWNSVLPNGLTFEESVNYLLGLVSIDFCHWGFDKNAYQPLKQFYTITGEGEQLRGSMAMCELAKKAYNKGAKLFEASFMQKVSCDEFRKYFMGVDERGTPMEIPMLEERVTILNEIGGRLLKKWKGSFSEILKMANRRLLNEGAGFLELLIQEFPRFKDEYNYRGKKIGIYKLAQLSAMALENALHYHPCYQSFLDVEVLTVCADYQIPKGLRALGLLEYEPGLATKIEKEEWLNSGSLEEIELRMASVYAGNLLKNRINSLLEKKGTSPITSIKLDYLVWSYGRHLKDKHHLTRSIMY